MNKNEMTKKEKANRKRKVRELTHIIQSRKIANYNLNMEKLYKDKEKTFSRTLKAQYYTRDELNLD